jgi:hypothetical protein
VTRRTEVPQARAKRHWSPLETPLATLLRGDHRQLAFLQSSRHAHTVDEGEPWITRIYGPSRSSNDRLEHLERQQNRRTLHGQSASQTRSRDQPGALDEPRHLGTRSATPRPLRRSQAPPRCCGFGTTIEWIVIGRDPRMLTCALGVDQVAHFRASSKRNVTHSYS